MRDEYDIENLNPRKNPYSNRVKKQITIKFVPEVIPKPEEIEAIKAGRILKSYYRAAYKGGLWKETAESKEIIYIGSDLPDEYSGSNYTAKLKGALAKVLYVGKGKKSRENV